VDEDRKGPDVESISCARGEIAAAWSRIVEATGYDQSDPHLQETPGRVARFFTEWHTVGTPPPSLTVFPGQEGTTIDELVAIGSIPFYSLCAHHGVPFFGMAAIGYIPKGRLLGLSKFARVVDHFARRFQVQERLTAQIADYLWDGLAPAGLGVILKAEHLCMSMRGIQRPGHRTITSDMRGVMRSDVQARQELLALVA
jgi:GTP cyclohydrolase I